MIEPVGEIDEYLTLKWCSKMKCDIRKFYNDIKDLSVWRNRNYICCVKFVDGILFISHLAKLGEGRGLKELLQELYNIYRPVFMMGIRGNNIVIYNEGKIRRKILNFKF
jgi:hypothetical protein